MTDKDKVSLHTRFWWWVLEKCNICSEDKLFGLYDQIDDSYKKWTKFVKGQTELNILFAKKLEISKKELEDHGGMYG